MRILSGRWAGRDLVSPGGRVRPTAEGLRGPLLDHLAPWLGNARVLDLFAGTGALGLEAMSRGARSCDFVENGKGALHSLKANVARFRLKGRTRIFRKDAVAFAAALEADAYDLCFADPPYTSALADRLAAQWLDQPFSRILAIEHAATDTLRRARSGVLVSRVEHEGSAATIYRTG